MGTVERAGTTDSENARLRRIIRHLHPDTRPDPLTEQMMRVELGDDDTSLFLTVIDGDDGAIGPH